VRDVDASCTVDDLSDLASVFVAPSAELEAECKVRRHECSADDVTVLFDDRFRLGSEEDEKFQHATDSAEGETRIRHGCHICITREVFTKE
jgi:hypothetical protein